MNKSKVWSFSGSESSDAFQPLRGYCSVEKRRNRIATCKCPERLRTRAFMSLEGFRMYMHYGRVSVPSLHRESTDSLIMYSTYTCIIYRYCTCTCMQV